MTKTVQPVAIQAE